LVLLSVLVAGTAAVSATSTAHVPPPTRVEDVVETMHGVEVHDPYRWLEDGRSPGVRAWAEGQNAFTRRHLDGLPGREWLTRRLTEVSYVDTVGVPRRAGARLFFTRRMADQEKAVLYWRGDDGADHVLVDPATLGTGGSVSLGEWVPSPDGSKLAYALSENNADEATLYVKDVATGEVSARDRIDGAKYATPSWTPDGDGFYYTWVPTDPRVSVAAPTRPATRWSAPPPTIPAGSSAPRCPATAVGSWPT
jgi:prolyl oligopeptidase